MMSLFASWPSFSASEAEAVKQVILSNRVNYWTGDECREFERDFAAWAGTDYAVALANGTLALEGALRVVGVGIGDEVIVTPRTFIASVSSIINVGATPVFADIDRDTQNITAETIAPLLTNRTKAIICVHLAGMPCDMDPIMDLARERGVFVIEDCAQAHGARYKGRSVGSIGHVGAWSFCQDKIMTTGGEGGMVTTNNVELWSGLWSYKDHGKSYEAIYNRDHPPGFRWLHNSFGTNWRMLELQAVLGRMQLKQMELWKAARQSNAARISEVARCLPGLRVPVMPEWADHAGYKLYLFVEPDRLSLDWNRDRIMTAIDSRGVPCNVGSCPEVYLEKAFEGTRFRPATRLTGARELGETSLSLLIHPTLTPNDIQRTCSVLKEVMSVASR